MEEGTVSLFFVSCHTGHGDQILSEKDIWAADAIQLYHWDGSYWRGFYTAEEIAKEEYYFNDLELADGNNLWLSGTYKRGDDYGGNISLGWGNMGKCI